MQRKTRMRDKLCAIIISVFISFDDNLVTECNRKGMLCRIAFASVCAFIAYSFCIVKTYRNCEAHSLIRLL